MPIVFLINRKTIRIIKNNAVPAYARKLVSGLGKKNNTMSPIRIIIGIKLFIFIISYGKLYF